MDLSFLRKPIRFSHAWKALGTSHPKFIEAAGLTFLLIAGAWSFILIDQVDGAAKSGEYKNLLVMIQNLEANLANDNNDKRVVAEIDAEFSKNLYEINQSAQKSWFFFIQKIFRWAMYLLGSLLILWAKIREGQDAMQAKIASAKRDAELASALKQGAASDPAVVPPAPPSEPLTRSA